MASNSKHEHDTALGRKISFQVNIFERVHPDLFAVLEPLPPGTHRVSHARFLMIKGCEHLISPRPPGHAPAQAPAPEAPLPTGSAAIFDPPLDE